MIVVRLMGGLGNQMFQYAAALRLARLHNAALKLDLTFLLDRSPRENFTFRDFALSIYDLPIQIASVTEVQHFRRLANPRSRGLLGRLNDRFSGRHYYCEPHLDFNSKVLNLPNNTYLEGYFQDERYFEDIASELRSRFHPALDKAELPSETRRLADKIRASKSVCFHVRRGDYAANPVVTNIYGLCGVDFYERGLAELRSLHEIEQMFVFSDDTEWCRDNFKSGNGVTVVGNEHAGVQGSTHLWLMSLCRYFVIGNSSFAWWAAWLSERDGKIVCRPKPWFADAALSRVEVCPRQWIGIAR